MVRVTVPIPERAYEVVVGHGLLEDAARYLPEFPKAERAFVIADRGSWTGRSAPSQPASRKPAWTPCC